MNNLSFLKVTGTVIISSALLLSNAAKADQMSS